jgi:hypothetical protein
MMNGRPSYFGVSDMLSILLGLTCTFAPPVEPIPPQPVDGSISWIYDLAEGRRRAAEADKPLFIVFRCER